jgi:hypothetical protein
MELVKRIDILARKLYLVAIEDLGYFFEGGTPRFDVENADEDEFEEDPPLRQSVLIKRKTCGGVQGMLTA